VGGGSLRAVRRRARLAGVAALAAVAVAAAGCGSSGSTSSPTTASGAATTVPSPSGTTAPSSGTTAAPGGSTAGKFLACMVTDTGGIDDRSFNASAYQGLTEAAAADSDITPTYLQSNSSSDYVPNIQAFINRKCGIIVTVGFLMATATQNAAKANPDVHFAIVDNEYTPALKNVLALTYETDQDAFLGGYLAAAMSTSKVVGTFGGLNIPTVTIYENGFVAGVRYYDQTKHADVKVLGWNPNTQKGVFAGSFTDQSAGKADTQTLINNGADVIFPVAGSVGLGSAQAVQQAGSGHYMEWVDTDGCVSAPQFCSLFLTSVTKGIATSVKDAVVNAAHGSTPGGNYVGTLANGGVALSPFHDYSSKIPASVQAELKTLTAGIESGKISVDPTKYPAS
jgi:basic membrane protein A